MSKIKFRHKITLFEFICRYIIYSVALATMFFAIDAFMKHTLINRIWLSILIIVTIIFHLDSMKRLGRTMKNDRMTFNIFKAKSDDNGQ